MHCVHILRDREGEDITHIVASHDQTIRKDSGSRAAGRLEHLVCHLTILQWVVNLNRSSDLILMTMQKHAKAIALGEKNASTCHGRS